MSKLSAIKRNRGQKNYSAAKAGIVNFTQASSEEWSDFNINVIHKNANISIENYTFNDYKIEKCKKI